MAIDLAQLTMKLDRRYVLCIQKLYHRPHFTVGRCWNESLQLQPLQRLYYENSGSSASACVMRRHDCITYTQSLDAINGFIAVGQGRNLLCGRLSYYQSVRPNDRSFTANSGTKAAVLLKGRPSTAISRTQVAVLLRMDRCGSLPLFSAPHSLFSI